MLITEFDDGDAAVNLIAVPKGNEPARVGCASTELLRVTVDHGSWQRPNEIGELQTVVVNFVLYLLGDKASLSGSVGTPPGLYELLVESSQDPGHEDAFIVENVSVSADIEPGEVTGSQGGDQNGTPGIQFGSDESHDVGLLVSSPQRLLKLVGCDMESRPAVLVPKDSIQELICPLKANAESESARDFLCIFRVATKGCVQRTVVESVADRIRGFSLKKTAETVVDVRSLQYAGLASQRFWDYVAPGELNVLVDMQNRTKEVPDRLAGGGVVIVQKVVEVCSQRFQFRASLRPICRGISRGGIVQPTSDNQSALRCLCRG